MDDTSDNGQIPPVIDYPDIEYIKTGDDFNRFSRRFTVFEDSDVSEFHFPEKPSEACAGCGKPAEYAIYAMVRKSRLLESLPSLDRISSEYRVFGLPLCRACAPDSELGASQTGKASSLGACLFMFMVLLIFILGTLAVLYYGINIFAIYPFRADGPHETLVKWWKLAILLTVWGVIYTFICYAISRIFSWFSLGHSHVKVKFKSLLDNFIETLKSDRWEYVDRTPLYPIDKELQFQDIVSYSYHLWGLVYLFRKKLAYDQYVQLFNRNIYELAPENYKSWMASEPGEGECRLCSKRMGKPRKFMLYRQIGATLGGKSEGYAREYGLLELNICDECWTGNRQFQFGRGGKSSMRWIMPVIIFASVMLLASIYVAKVILKIPFLTDDPLWLGLTLKVIIAPLIICVFIIIGIIAGTKVVDVKEKKVERNAEEINIQELLIADSATEHGWAVMRHPEESDFDLSPNLKYWFDQFGVH